MCFWECAELTTFETQGTKRLTTANRKYSIVIPERVLRQAILLCKKRWRETGGIIIGYYSDDSSTATITSMSKPPKDSRAGVSWFERGVHGLNKLLRKVWGLNTPQYYLGEWHYHPAKQIHPSPDDLEQMLAIRKNDDYQCKEPIMIILGIAAESRVPLRAFVFSEKSQELELIMEESKK